MDFIYILGVKLHKIKREEILDKIKNWLCGKKFHYITTVNPEFALEAQKDAEFKEILNNSDLAVPDGIGLKFAAWMFGKNIHRYAGADLAEDILRLAEQKNCSLYFFIWKDGLSDVEEIRGVIKVKAGDGQSRRLRIDGQAIERDGNDIDWEKLNKFNSDILLVGLGAPYQEKAITKIRNEKKIAIKVAIGIGGTFDFLTGKIKRAPKIMRLFGMEWCWRLLQQPKKQRFKRIFNAVITFPCYVILWRLRMIFKLRKGATAVILNNKDELLLCQRADESEHWQFPKGGMKKEENSEDAVKREVFEEVGLKNIKIIKKLDKKHIYTYNKLRHKGKLIKLKCGFKGQINDIFIIRFLGGEEVKIDNKEFIGYKWVSPDKLLDSLQPFRKEIGEIVLAGFEKL